MLATQNPIEYEGTYPLPEAQVDRFMIRISLGYPDPAAEAGMLEAHQNGDQVLALTPVATAAELLAAQDAAARVRASAPLREYIVNLLWRTREDPRVELGASPRAGSDAAACREGARDDERPRPRAPRRRPGARRRRCSPTDWCSRPRRRAPPRAR